MSEFYQGAVKALASIIEPDTRIVVVLAASAGEDETRPVLIRMRVLEDCEADKDSLAALLRRAGDMVLDPDCIRPDLSVAVM